MSFLTSLKNALTSDNIFYFGLFATMITITYIQEYHESKREKIQAEILRNLNK